MLTALIQLSSEAMEVASSQHKEPSFFGVAKMFDLGAVNIDRFELIWKPMTNHLLDVCSHINLKVREFGVTSLTALVRTAFAQPDPSNISEKIVSRSFHFTFMFFLAWIKDGLLFRNAMGLCWHQ